MVRLVLGSAAVCRDGYRGQLRAVALDPAAGTVTHLVVEPDGRIGLARLVPLDLLDATAGVIRLGCTEAEFRALAGAEETLAEFVPGYQVPVQLLPPGWRDAGGPTATGATIPRVQEKETVDIIPRGEVAEHGGEHVHAADGPAGRLHAVCFDPASRQVSHLVVSEGHLLSRTEVAVPFSSVARLEDGIQLSITRQQLRELPPADTDPSAS
jgi:sporulation protein YlmC with PRC-barrel domain